MAKNKVKEKATINDVARDAGVSIKTVSRVINKEKNIRDATRERVEASILKLQYSPNMAARGLAANHSFKLALLYDNTRESVNFNYFINLQNGVLDCCRAEGYDLLIHPCAFSNRYIAKDIIEMAEKVRLSGLILNPPLSDNLKLIKKLTNAGLTISTVASTVNNCTVANVVSDDELASFNMTRHLIELGHERIAIIRGPVEHGFTEIRFEGFKRALKEAGLKLPEKYVKQGDFNFDSGRYCAQALIRLKERPTAVFVANDEMAIGVIHEAMNSGISVPEELSVTGFDDSMTSRQTVPTLTTVHQPTRLMSQRAAQLLVEAKRSGNKKFVTSQITLKHRIIVRNSTAAPP